MICALELSQNSCPLCFSCQVLVIGPVPALPTDSFSLTFTKAGKYPYLCLLHPGMAGTVEVS